MKTKKKITSIILTLILTVGMVSLNGATSVYASESDTVDTFTGEVSGNGWKLSETGVLTLLSDIPFVSGQPYEWEQYAEQITEVVVAEGVTEIPNSAFSTHYKNLKKVTMSSTVKEIGVAAFAYNSNLTEVYLNNGLKEVGNIAFASAGFTEINLPEGVVWSSDVFYECNNLVSVTIPKGSKWNGSNAHFYGCDNLKEVIIEEGVEEIPSTFLNECANLQYVWIPKSVTSIVGTPILDGVCIIGYKGTVAEEYVNSPTGQVNKLSFHAIDGEEHSFGEWQTVQNPTCTEKGIMKHTCTICNAERTQEIDATGHIWDNGKVTQEATEKTEGIKTFTCTVCNATRTETIEKLVPSENDNLDKEDKGNTQENKVSTQISSNSPKTGDNANVFVWILLMIVSVGTITVFFFKKRITR